MPSLRAQHDHRLWIGRIRSPKGPAWPPSFAAYASCPTYCTRAGSSPDEALLPESASQPERFDGECSRYGRPQDLARRKTPSRAAGAAWQPGRSRAAPASVTGNLASRASQVCVLMFRASRQPRPGGGVYERVSVAKELHHRSPVQVICFCQCQGNSRPVAGTREISGGDLYLPPNESRPWVLAYGGGAQGPLYAVSRPRARR